VEDEYAIARGIEVALIKINMSNQNGQNLRRK
jgi:hypothetical protein